jgi:small-conductance mechanosensitive channel
MLYKIWLGRITMTQVIHSLKKLAFYLVILLIISIGTITIFALFIDPHVSLPTLIDQTLKIAFAIGFSSAAILIVRHFKPFMTERMGNQASTILQYVLFAVALLFMSFAILNTLRVSASALLTGAGIISITAGLVISTFVGSLLSGLLVFTNYRFDVGEDVMLNNIPGKVAEMTALVMRIQTDVGQVTIPNSAIASGGVIITAVHKYERLEQSRLPYTVGDRVITSYASEQGMVKQIAAFYTIVELDSGKQITFLNNSVLSGGVPIAKVTQLPSSKDEKE